MRGRGRNSRRLDGLFGMLFPLLPPTCHNSLDGEEIFFGRTMWEVSVRPSLRSCLTVRSDPSSSSSSSSSSSRLLPATCRRPRFRLKRSRYIFHSHAEGRGSEKSHTIFSPPRMNSPRDFLTRFLLLAPATTGVSHIDFFQDWKEGNNFLSRDEGGWGGAFQKAREAGEKIDRSYLACRTVGSIVQKKYLRTSSYPRG